MVRRRPDQVRRVEPRVRTLRGRLLVPPRARKMLPDNARWLSRASSRASWDGRINRALFRGAASGRTSLFDALGRTSSPRARLVHS